MSDDLPLLLLLDRVLAVASRSRFFAQAVQPSVVPELRQRVRLDIDRCTRDEFDAIVHWLTSGPGDDPGAER